MLEFSVSNQLLSRLDATKVVADSKNYLECAFQFSEDWQGAVAVAVFGHSKVKEPISVRIVDGKCLVPHEVIKTYGFQLSVCGTAEEGGGAVCHIPTNVVTVEVEASGEGQGLTPEAPTKSMYDSLMTAIAAGEEAATAAKVSAQASAEAARGAKTGAEAARTGAEAAVKAAEANAEACAWDAENTRLVWTMVRTMRREMEALAVLQHSYVVGSGADETLCNIQNIAWKQGGYTRDFLGLDAGQRYQVRVDGTWYDVAAQWDLEEVARTDGDGQAELTGTEGGASLFASADPGGEDIVPEIPEGDEVTVVPETPGGDGDGEVPEIPGGEETKPGGEETEPDGLPVVKPVLYYETVRDVVRLTAGPVTVEDVTKDQEKGEAFLCRITTKDSAVREIEIRTDGNVNAKYFYQQAVAAAERAEAAAARAEAQAAQA